MTCDAWQVVVVPFPFTDRSTAKRRPALVLSGRGFNGHGFSVLAMLTSASHAPWPGDTPVSKLRPAGLTAPSLGSCHERRVAFEDLEHQPEVSTPCRLIVSGRLSRGSRRR